MMTIDQETKAELVREIATALASKQRLAFASDFHAFAEGRELVLDQVHMKVSSMDGQDEIARLEGIEARVLVSLWENL